MFIFMRARQEKALFLKKNCLGGVVEMYVTNALCCRDIFSEFDIFLCIFTTYVCFFQKYISFLSVNVVLIVQALLSLILDVVVCQMINI